MLTREAVLAEGVPGGFTAVYGVLKVLEERGQVRRGYFVAGLGAAQFALPGSGRPPPVGPRSARRTRPTASRRSCWPPPIRLSPTARRWPGRTRPVGRHGPPARSWCSAPGGRWSGWTVAGTTWSPSRPPSRITSWADALAALVKDGRVRALEVRKVDGQPVGGGPAVAAALKQAGFVEGYRGLIRRG